MIIKFTPQNMLSFGSCGSQYGQFINPKDVKVHYSTGNIFVADTTNNRIQRITRSSGSITTWPIISWGQLGTNKGEFNKPVAIAVDPSSSEVYVSDKNNNRIQKLTGTGDPITSLDGIWSNGMYVNSEKNLYVSVAGTDKIYKFSPNFELIREWGGTGTSNGKFRNPYGITVDYNNDVYIVDRGNWRIQKFTKEGAHLKTFGGQGTISGKFITPYGIAFDASNNTVHVSDYSNRNIQSFTPDGVFVKKIIL
jgi:DNA-binding beta-propeller fold protein YncE